MPTLTLAIDARRAKEGAQEFQRAARDAGQAAGDAAKRTGELEKGIEKAGGKARGASKDTADLGRETRALTASEREAEISARRLAEATQKTTDSHRKAGDAIHAEVDAGRDLLAQQGRLRDERGRFLSRGGGGGGGGPAVGPASGPSPFFRPSQLPAGVRGAEVLSGLQTLGSQLGPIGGQLASFTGQAAGAGEAIGGIAGVAGLSSTALLGLGAAFTATAAVTAAAISANLDFERSLKGLNALLDSSAELEQRRQSIYAQSYRTGQSTDEIAKGQEAITRLFRGDADAIERITRAAESFSTATGTRYSAAAQALAQTINGFKISANDAGLVAAKLFSSAREGNQEFIQFSGALSTLGDEARAAGVGFGQLSVVLSRAASETNLGEATAAVRRFLIALNDETDPATQKLVQLGAQLQRLPDGSRDLAQALGEIKRVTGGSAETIAGIYGNRDFSTVFAALSTDLGKVSGAAKSARSEIEALNSSIERQQSINAARFDKFKEAASSALEELGGGILAGDILEQYRTIPKILAGTFAEADKVAQKTKEIRPAPEAVSEFEKIAASIAQLQAPRAVGQIASPARDEARRVLEAFKNDIVNSRANVVPVEISIQSQPEEVRAAFDAVRQAIESEAPPGEVFNTEFEAQLKTLEAAGPRIASQSKARSQALGDEFAKVEAGRTSIEGMIRALEDEGKAIGLTARELAALRSVRDAERIATASGLTLKDSEIEKLRALALANFDAADAAKKRADAEARSATAKASYSSYVDSLREQVRLLSLSTQGLSEEEIAIQEAVGRAQELADAFREAQRALGADPRTVENLVPDQSASIDQVRALVEEITRLKALQGENPVSRYGPFIPEAVAAQPGQGEVFGPEFDASAQSAYDRLQELRGSIGQERDLLGLSSDARERALFLREAENEAIRAGIQDRDALIQEMGREFEQFQKLRDLDQLGKDVGHTLASGFEEAIFQAKSFNDAIRDIGREIAQLAFRQFVTKPLTDSLGGLFSGLFTGGAGAGGGGFAHGAVFSGGNVVPFASGGIFDQPTYFPMSGGRTGLLGESGPEAIMPLTRGPGGKLGVRADAAQAPSQVVSNTTHVSMTVVTQDANSFKRSSRQITADLKKRL